MTLSHQPGGRADSRSTPSTPCTSPPPTGWTFNEPGAVWLSGGVEAGATWLSGGVEAGATRDAFKPLASTLPSPKVLSPPPTSPAVCRTALPPPVGSEEELAALPDVADREGVGVVDKEVRDLE